MTSETEFPIISIKRCGNVSFEAVDGQLVSGFKSSSSSLTIKFDFGEFSVVRDGDEGDANVSSASGSFESADAASTR